jgi:hypothetical protein
VLTRRGAARSTAGELRARAAQAEWREREAEEQRGGAERRVAEALAARARAERAAGEALEGCSAARRGQLRAEELAEQLRVEAGAATLQARARALLHPQRGVGAFAALRRAAGGAVRSERVGATGHDRGV